MIDYLLFSPNELKLCKHCVPPIYTYLFTSSSSKIYSRSEIIASERDLLVEPLLSFPLLYPNLRFNKQSWDLKFNSSSDFFFIFFNYIFIFLSKLWFILIICFFWTFSWMMSFEVADSFNLISSALIITLSSYLHSSSASFLILLTSLEVNDVNCFLFFWAIYWPNLGLFESIYSPRSIKLTSLLEILDVPFKVSSRIRE